MNQLSQQTITSFVDADLQSYDLNTLPINPAQAHQWLQGEFLDEWQELNQPKVMQARHHYFSIENTTADDYQEYCVALSQTQSIICGIRHKGGNSNQPFIQVRPNFVIEHTKQLAAIQAATDGLFRAFHPQHMAFWRSAPLPQCHIEAQYMVAHANTIIAQSAWPQESDIQLKTVEDNDYYAWYDAIYRQFHLDHPSLKDRVQQNSVDEFEEAQQQGLLYFIYFKQQRVGLISAQKNDLLGHPGVYFNEILLDKPWRGLGLAKAAQRQFIVQNVSKNDVVWGTINTGNIPSIHTAYANQRRSIRYECFYPINRRDGDVF